MELFGIKFVPLNEPLEMRLQTLAAAFWILMFCISVPLGWLLTLVLIIYTSVVRWFVISYLVLIYLFDWDTCEHGGWSERWCRWMRNCICWRYYRDYFPIKLVKTAELDPAKNYLLCYAPHGLMCAGLFGAFATESLGVHALFPGLRITPLTLVQSFRMPIFREFLHSIGACAVSKKSIEYLISTPGGGRAAVIVVGGAEESMYCDSGNYRIILRKRTGFMRIALEHGTPLVPVIGFGELDLYKQIHVPENSFMKSLQIKVRRLTGYSPVIPLGRGFLQLSFGLIPHRRPITVVDPKNLLWSRHIKGVYLNHLEEIRLLAYNDGVVVFAHCYIHMKRVITALYEYYSLNRLKINVDKTNVILFQ